MNNNIFKTINNPVEKIIFKEKGSKFIGYLYEFNNINQLKDILQKIKIDYPNASHYCYAFRIGIDGETYRANDDGEPMKTAGIPILNQLISADLSNIILIVVRYFGGTKLGVGGLIKAYKETAIMTINQSNIIEKELSEIHIINFNFKNISIIDNWIKKNKIKVLSKNYNEDCNIIVEIPLSKKEDFVNFQNTMSHILN